MMGLGSTGWFILLAVAGVAFLFGWLASHKVGKNRLDRARHLADQTIVEAKREAENQKRTILLEARDECYKLKTAAERELQGRQAEFQRTEKRLNARELALDRKADLVSKKERDIHNLERDLKRKGKMVNLKGEQLDRLIAEHNTKLERIAGLTQEEAKQLLLSNLESQVRREAVLMAKQIRDEAKRSAKREARKIITSAIQRCAAEYTIETTVSVVSLPSDEMKGRIIGREGRNIRTFETVTGIEVIVDDTPEAVILSGFDPIRRETAKLALERLVQDGRIHPARIEEVVAKAREDVEELIREAGEHAVMELGFHDMHPDLVNLVGKLRFRLSYGQNILYHSLEVARLCGLIAAELQLDMQLAKRAGLLHDIGKAIDREMEGTHTEIGVELARKYGEHPEVISAIGDHHEDIEWGSPFTVLVQAADAISSSRPGARRETLESYIRRLTKLEALANSFNGVVKSYAIQAGREIRVMVEPEEVDDLSATQMATELAHKIQQEMQYPGQIKVTVIRESRAVDYAR